MCVFYFRSSLIYLKWQVNKTYKHVYSTNSTYFFPNMDIIVLPEVSSESGMDHCSKFSAGIRIEP